MSASRHVLRCHEVAAAVLLEVEDKALHALLFQFVDFGAQLAARGLSEAVDADIAHLLVHHIRALNGMHGDFVALHGEVEHFGHAAAHDAEGHFRVFRPAQFLHDVGAVHLHAGNSVLVYEDDAVAGKDARPLARPFGNGLYHDERVFHHVELHADALETAFEGFVEFFCFFGIGIGGMRVEFFKHSANGIFGKFLLVHAVHVERGDGRLRHLQFFELLKVDIVEALSRCRQRAEGGY